MQKSFAHKLKSYLLIALLAVSMGLNYELFVFPNAFAPAGVNGIATIVQYLFHFNIGYFSLIINAPLLVLAYVRVGREFALKNAVFILTFSATTLILSSMDLRAIAYHTENGTSAILGPVAAGVISGAIYGCVIRLGASTGGTDIVAAVIQRSHPEFRLVWIIFVMNAAVAVCSFFVYDCKFEPVILCLLYCFLSSNLSDRLLKGGERALKFEVITEHAEALSALLLHELHHGVTVLPAYGMYSGHEKKLLICVVNPRQIVAFHHALSQFPDTFAYITDVNETYGNFKHPPMPRTSHGKSHTIGQKETINQI